jgi:hypothetical protein
MQQELAALRARVAELEDPSQQAARIAEHLPQSLSHRPPTDPDIARALSPLIELAVWEALRRSDPPSRGAVSHILQAIRSCLSAPADIARNLPFCRQPAARGEIMCLRLIHRGTYTLMEEFTRPMDDSQELRAILSMLALLQEKLRDETFQAGYEKLGSLRVGNLTYGIHVGPLALLFSVIRGNHPAPALARCKAALEAVHQVHAVALGDYDPRHGPLELLPSDLYGRA